MLKIGFTGTRHGMQTPQSAKFKELMSQFHKDHTDIEFHHGDCIGSDEEAHNISKTEHTKVMIHPPSDNRFRAYCKGDAVLKPLPYLKRNHNIVNASEILIATPDTQEKVHSGTWATIRYARKKDKAIYIIKPNGQIKFETPVKKENENNE